MRSSKERELVSWDGEVWRAGVTGDGLSVGFDAGRGEA